MDLRQKKIVDTREPGAIRTRLLEIGWVQEALYTGDYTWFTISYKKVGIERKTVPDLLGSLGDRMSTQLFNMLEHYDVSILLIEGNWQVACSRVTTPEGVERWFWATVWNFLQTWQDRGITLQLTANEGHTIKRLNELYAYYQRNCHTGGLNRHTIGDPRLMAFFCSGIGLKLSETIMKKFGSIQNAANASIQDFLSIEGIGEQKATALYNHLTKNRDS